MTAPRHERPPPAASVLARAASTPWLYFLAAAVSAAVYLGVSASDRYLGFPLDDAWIHQTYARSLGTRGEFAFMPGAPSAGSTAPLWSALLAVGYASGVEPRAWAYTLGALALGLAAWLTARLVRQAWPERPAAALAAGLATALEWHLAWAAVSGMETALFAALAVAVFAVPERRAAWVGGLVGLSVLVRPDGLLLLPFALARVWLAGGRNWRGAARCGAGFLAVFLPYLGFNLGVGGALWPNTFYAKQAEYAVMQALPLWQRAGSVGFQPWIGAQVLLIPGLAVFAWRAARGRRWEQLAPLAWAGAVLAAYSVRLPVIYQYGRYVMPVIPVLIGLGAGGLSGLLRLRSAARGPRLASRVWLASALALWLAFWGIGAGLYLRDVRVIETEMVAAARWVAAHTAPDAVVAAHDIGALGYYGGRPVLDMAGLVSPEAIPFIRDEAQLADWLTRSGADYLMTFPGWYPALTGRVADRELFRTNAPYSPAIGGENMVVYRWVEGDEEQ